MKQKIKEIELSLLRLKEDYKKAFDETIPEIYQRLKKLENLENRINTLEINLKKIKSEITYTAEDNQELPHKFILESQKDEITIKEKTEVKEPVIKPENKVKKVNEKSVVLLFLSNLLKSMLGPFESLLASFSSFYRHYKDQGKGPAFLMTLTGIVALVLGFGYLIQYSFSNFFNEWAKIITVFLCGFGIIIGAKKLYYKNEQMRDYASGLIGLGVIINYLGIYGAGPYYNLVGSLFAFVLLILNTLFAFYLSVHFTTRVVSFIAMTGGIFFPLALGSGGESAGLYLGYLFILCIMTMFVAYKIKWEILSYLTILLSLFMVDATASQGLFHLVMVHLFFYLYFYFIMFDGRNIKDVLLKKEIIILSALFVCFAEFIISLSHSKEIAGFVLALNAMVFAGLFFKFIKDNIKSIFLIFSGLFAGIAIFNLVSPHFAGTIWGLEALILIYTGFFFHEIFVRKEGYLIFCASIAGIFFIIAKSLVSEGDINLSTSFINLFFAGIYLFVLRFLMEKNDNILKKSEQIIVVIVDNSVFVWMSSAYLFFVYNFLCDYIFVLGVLPLPYFLYRAAKRRLVFGEFFALAHLIFPLIQVFITGLEVNSFIFIDLALPGKIAQLEIFFSLIIIYHIYGKFNQKGHLFKLSTYLRFIFFGILPVCFLPGLCKYHYSYLPLILWGSVLIALFLYFYLKKIFMLYELEILALCGSAFSIYYSFLYLVKYMGTYPLTQFKAYNLQVIFNSIAGGIPIGLLVISGILIFTGAFKKENYKNEVFKRLYSGAFIYFAYAVFLYAALIMGSIYAGLCGFVLYSLYISFKRPAKPWFSDTYKVFFLGILLAIGFMALEIINHADNISWIYLLISVAGTGFFIHKEKYFLNDDQPLFKNKKQYLYFYFNIVVVLLFIILLNAFSIDIKGPYLTILLVIQGTILLFGTLKPVYRDCMKIPLLIFTLAFLKLMIFDVRGLSIIGKIIVFMGVGVVLIAGAYQFQKLRLKNFE